jgi:hypothetical protein
MIQEFTIDPTYFASVTVIENYSMYKSIPREELTDEQLIKIIKGEDRVGSVSSKDTEEFTELRNTLEIRGYIKVELSWWNGDEVLRPFYLNSVLFKKADTFPCAGAMKNHLKFKEKYTEK